MWVRFRVSPVVRGGRAGEDVRMTTLLIVDDHAGFRAHARALLEAEGLSVVGEAEDGASGLEAVRMLRPDVVLVDIGLPDIDGFELARRLAIAGPPPLVVLTSTRQASELGTQLRSTPALGFVSKDELSASAIRALASPT